MTPHRRTSLRLLVVLLVSALSLSPSAILAQTQFRSWKTCSVGTIRACNSVFLSTTPMLSGSTRTGTSWIIRLQNLQGTNPLDNTGGAVIMSAGWNYVTRDGSDPRTSGNPGVNGTPVGTGASGSGFWEWESQSMLLPFFSYNTSIFKNPIQGCDVANIPFGSFPASFRTCGTDAMIEFAFSTPTILDAESFEGGSITNVGVDGNSYRCDFYGSDGCVLESTVTPEPATMLLVGTGLAGLGGWSRRRRRRSAIG
jgi:hypothetical protein